MGTMTIHDRYPSRVAARPEILDRADPVVYGDPADGPLRSDQLAAFERDGFLQIETVFSLAEVERLRAEARRLAASPAVAGDERTITEPGGNEVRSIFEVHRRDAFAELAADKRLAGVARQLLGSAVYIHQSRLNLKPGFRGKEFYWHSDFETWHTEDGMPAMRAVSASIALTPNAEWNGPLMIIPGSHTWFVACVGETPAEHYRHSLKSQEVGTPDDASLSRLMVEAGDRIATFPGGAGSVVFFDCNAMHGSASNISPWPRSNAFFVYNSVENALGEPYAAPAPRPEFIASRDFTPLP